MLVVKSCEELLRSCGINILVVFTNIPVFCLDYKLPTTKNIRTRNTLFGKIWLGFLEFGMIQKLNSKINLYAAPSNVSQLTKSKIKNPSMINRFCFQCFLFHVFMMKLGKTYLVPH